MKYIGFSADLFDNFNINFVVILLLVALGGILYWLSIYYRDQRFYKICLKCWTSWMFYWIIFINVPTSVSTWVTFIYS
jgi:hypothetical protein